MELQKLLSYTLQAVKDYHLIEQNDKIMIGLSGGKDSIALLYALSHLRRFYPNSFSIHAVTVDMGFSNYDTTSLQKLCDLLQVPFTKISTKIGTIIFEERKEKNPCSLCANLRRGAINSIAIEQGCNKIALGHNQDDVLETFLLNLLYFS